MSQKAVVLRTKDNKTFKTTLQVATMSQTIKQMVDDLGLDEMDECPEIPLDNLSSGTLAKILLWLEHHKDEPQPTSEQIQDKLAETIDIWDQNYLKIPLEELYELITASNFLNIPGLLWITTRQIAYMIKSKTPEEIRAKFNIENDWSPESLAQVQRENEWCEEM